MAQEGFRRMALEGLRRMAWKGSPSERMALNERVHNDGTERFRRMALNKRVHKDGTERFKKDGTE